MLERIQAFFIFLNYALFISSSSFSISLFIILLLFLKFIRTKINKLLKKIPRIFKRKKIETCSKTTRSESAIDNPIMASGGIIVTAIATPDK